DVPAHRAGVADLRRADFARRVDHGRVQPPDLRVFRQVGDLHGGAARTPASGRGDRRVGEALDVDDAIGRRDVVLHPRDEVHAAGERQRDTPVDLERGDRVFLVRGVCVLEGFHSVPPAFCSSMAARILCGMSGSDRMVAPVAFRTALAMDEAVETVGGSPMPMTPRARCTGEPTTIVSFFGMPNMPASMDDSMFGLTSWPVPRRRIRSSNNAKLSEPTIPP